MPTTSPTCGARYRALVDTLFPPRATDIPDLHPLILARPPGTAAFAIFAVGSMAGEASKVALGACQAFMIRPAPDWWAWSQDAMRLVCTHYGLVVHVATAQGEIWGVAPGDQSALSLVLSQPVNSPRWHVGRARLCGIPAAQIDPRYHARDTYGVRCEPEGKDA